MPRVIIASQTLSDKFNIPALHRALAALPAYAGLPVEALEPLPEKGLAHNHIRLAGTGHLLRVPMQSQFALGAKENLAYQAACFERVSASGHAPRLHGLIAPSEEVPMGALIVDEIEGSPVTLPGDMAGIAQCLAAVHQLPLPPPEERAPLADHRDPVAGTLGFIEDQATFVEQAADDPDARAMIFEEVDWARAFAAEAAGTDQPQHLVCSDTHPGNYLLGVDGRVFIVDLEKALYGAPGIDLAHASLHTSTTWDIHASASLDRADIARFYAAWNAAVGAEIAARNAPWLLPLRRLTWLRSTTWSCKWAVQSGLAARRDKHAGGATEDWSIDGMDPVLVAHVRDRVADFVNPETIARIRAEWLGPDRLELA